MEPKVSIICAVRNKEQYIEETISSVLKQTYKNFEFLIWDDNSTDDTLKKILSFRDERIMVTTDIHRGQASCLHELINMSKGDFIGWVDGDDTLEPDCLARSVRALMDNPRYGVIYTDHYETDMEGNRICIGHRSHIPYTPTDLLFNFMTFHFRMFRKEVYNHCLPIDTSLTAAADYDLCLKMSEVTRFKHLPIPLYNYRSSDNSDSIVNKTRMEKTVLHIIQEAIARRKMNMTVDLEYDDNGIARYRYAFSTS